MRGMRCSKRARARNHLPRDYLGPAGRGRSVLRMSRQPLRRVWFWRTCRRWHLGCCGSRVATGGRLWLKVVSVGIRNRMGRFCCHAAVSRVGDGNCSATPSLSDFTGPRVGGRTAKCEAKDPQSGENKYHNFLFRLVRKGRAKGGRPREARAGTLRRID